MLFLFWMLCGLVNSKQVLSMKCFLTHSTSIDKLSREMDCFKMVSYSYWRFLGHKIRAQCAIVVPLVLVMANVLVQIFIGQVSPWNKEFIIKILKLRSLCSPRSHEFDKIEFFIRPGRLGSVGRLFNNMCCFKNPKSYLKHHNFHKIYPTLMQNQSNLINLEKKQETVMSYGSPWWSQSQQCSTLPPQKNHHLYR